MDENDSTPGNPAGPDGLLSLREAILYSNTHGGVPIDFAVAGTIRVAAGLGPLPTITVPTTIDGTTAPGYAGSPVVELDGSSTNGNGLTLSGGNSAIRALTIRGFGSSGIELNTRGGNTLAGDFILNNGVEGVLIQSSSVGNTIGGTSATARNVLSGNGYRGILINSGATGNVVQGNYIGTDVIGSNRLANRDTGVLVFSANNTIGGMAPGAGNVISGNARVGLWIYGSSATGNVVQGNDVGSDRTGTQSIGNSVYGILVSGAGNTTIGGTAAGARNIISGNVSDAVYLADGASGTVIQGNFIGTDVSGSRGLANGGRGIEIGGSTGAPNSTIGGTAAGARNVISANGDAGIIAYGIGTTGTVIQGNLIGTDISGTQALGNHGSGVYFGNRSSGNIIGGATPGTGNVISANGQDGVTLVENVTGTVLQGNHVGTNVFGTQALGNHGNGVLLSTGAKNNTIGGAGAGAGNVISGNSQDGVTITNNGTTGNVVQGNYIGTNANGTAALGNGYSGVGIGPGASANTIGGTMTGARNIISANGEWGVWIHAGATGTVVQGNLIGTNVAGTLALGNALDGLEIDGANTTVGGLVDGAGNVISGNTRNGILITTSSATGNSVVGNFIGTNANGVAAIANGGAGAAIVNAPSNTIGGTTATARNIISGNAANGVEMSGAGATGNMVEGNYIGIAGNGTQNLGNGGDGVDIFSGATNNTVGGTVAGAGNRIAYNHNVGVQVGSSLTDSVSGISIRGNSIFANGMLGIDLGGDRVTPNGGRYNFPVLNSAVVSGSTVTIEGMLITTDFWRNTAFSLDFFSNTNPDPSGFGQGEHYLGSTTVTTDVNGNASFTQSFDTSGFPSGFITATATYPGNNTSEFSAVPLSPRPGIVWVNEATSNIDSDGFNAAYTAYGSDKPALARSIVDAAIRSWNNVIVNFNYRNSGTPGWAPQSNTFFLNITGLGTAPGLTEAIGVDGDGKPFSASIQLNQNGSGSGWFFDPTPNDNGEFTDLSSRFAATFIGSSGYDFYTVITHEIGHALGIALGSGLAINNNNFLSSGGTDQINPVDRFGNPVHLSVFSHGSTVATLTAFNGGHIYEGPADPSFSNEPVSPYDLMNDARSVLPTPTERKLISDLDASILQAAYNYTITLPSVLQTFLAASEGTVLYVNGDPLMNNAINLRIYDAAGTPFVIVNVDGINSSWTGITSVIVTPGGGNNTINILNMLASVPVTINGGAGTNTLVGPDAVNSWHITGLNAGDLNGIVTFSSVQNLTGGLDDDTFVFSDGANVDGRIDGRGNRNTLDYSAFTSDILVNLATDSATGVGGGIANILRVTGGHGTNTLVGPEGVNSWHITGLNAGDVNGTITFTSIQNLTGGSGNDTFVLSNGAGVDGQIDGGGGINTLDYTAFTSNILVNLQNGSASSVGGGITTIQNVTGGHGTNILVGNGGNKLTGGTGRSLLIAGGSASTLIGNSDQDILIGGTTAYDTNTAALMAIMVEWSRTDEDYNTRVANLTTGAGVPLLDATTVTSNGGGNSLTRRPGGRDLFFGSSALDQSNRDPLTETFVEL